MRRKARELGAVGAGGDLYADGALGVADGARVASRTSTVRPGDCGHGYVTRRAGRASICVDCARARDAGRVPRDRRRGDRDGAGRVPGRGAAGRCWHRRLRAARHRIEHVEIVDKAMIAGLVEFGVVASMQPAFDRLWGGERQMYAQRLGVARSLESNPMGAMHGVGVALAFGSDSPVTPLDPWGSGAGGDAALQPGAADERAGGVRRAHPGRVAGGAPATTRGCWRRARRRRSRCGTPGGGATAACRCCGRGPGVAGAARIRRRCRCAGARCCAVTVISRGRTS